jgi:hypothetical protein
MARNDVGLSHIEDTVLSNLYHSSATKTTINLLLNQSYGTDAHLLKFTAVILL